MFRNAINFLKDRRGNIAPMFALSLIPAVGAIGTAVDYTRANSVKVAIAGRARCNDACHGEYGSDDQRRHAQGKRQEVFRRPVSKDEYDWRSTDDKIHQFEWLRTGYDGRNQRSDTVHEHSGICITQIPVGASSTSSWGNTRLRVALALDNTGSMASNNKMTALKTAAKNLIDQLKTAPPTTATSTSRSFRSQRTSTSVPAARMPHGSTGTTGKTTTAPAAATTAAITNPRAPASPPDGHGPPPATITGPAASPTATSPTTHHAPPSDANGGATRFPAEQYADCPVTIMPLSYDWNALKNKNRLMQPDGNTNTTIGLEWGWHSLTQGAAAQRAGRKTPTTSTRRSSSS